MLILQLLSRLPFPVLYAFSDFLFFVSYRLVGYRKKVVRKNLINSFPDKSEKELDQIEKGFYKNLCDYGVETLKLLTISEQDLRKRMYYRNADIAQEFADKNQSLIILASHQFNWEWLLTAGCLYMPMGLDFVYQKQSSKLFNNFSLVSRTRFGAFPIEREKVARESLSRRNILRGICVVADQFPGFSHDKKYWTQFMHQDTAFFQGIGQLASLTQYPVLFCEMRKVKRGYYETEMVILTRPPYPKESNAVVDEYVKATEKIIKENPSGWLWSHKRWKRGRGED